MDQKNKAKLFTFLYIFLIISLILFMIWIVFWLRGNSKDCLADPIEYYKSKQKGIECACYNEQNLISKYALEEKFDIGVKEDGD